MDINVERIIELGLLSEEDVEVIRNIEDAQKRLEEIREYSAVVELVGYLNKKPDKLDLSELINVAKRGLNLNHVIASDMGSNLTTGAKGEHISIEQDLLVEMLEYSNIAVRDYQNYLTLVQNSETFIVLTNKSDSGNRLVDFRTLKKAPQEIGTLETKIANWKLTESYISYMKIMEDLSNCKHEVSLRNVCVNCQAPARGNIEIKWGPTVISLAEAGSILRSKGKAALVVECLKRGLDITENGIELELSYSRRELFKDKHKLNLQEIVALPKESRNSILSSNKGYLLIRLLRDDTIYYNKDLIKLMEDSDIDIDWKPHIGSGAHKGKVFLCQHERSYFMDYIKQNSSHFSFDFGSLSEITEFTEW